MYPLHDEACAPDIGASIPYQVHTPVKEREDRLIEVVTEIVQKRGGRCLIPVFALGKAQVSSDIFHAQQLCTLSNKMIE
jgi:Cft2 family RNA processing exonuclease